MRMAVVGLVALGLAACTTGGGGSSGGGGIFGGGVPDNPQKVVDERVAIMKGFVGALSGSGAYVQGKGTVKDAQAKVAAARAGADRLQDLFPRGTALGDKGVTRSRALSTIFSNRSDFDAKLAAMARALGALDGALMRGAKAEATAALNNAKVTCGSCHTKYRTADE